MKNTTGLADLAPPDVHVVTGLFDRRVLRPLAWLRNSLAPHPITDGWLMDRAALGWYPVLPDRSGEPCVPLYAPSRAQLLIECEGEGWTADELRGVAEHEEWLIDHVLTIGALSYEDDDQTVIVRYIDQRVRLLETRARLDDQVEQSGIASDIVRATELLEGLQLTDWQQLVKSASVDWRRFAERVRAYEDHTRLQTLNLVRQQVEHGYSPNVVFRCAHFDLRSGLHVDGIRWRATLDHCGSDNPTVRVPGFVLEHGRIRTSETLSPAVYARLWRQHGLDDYLREWSDARSQRICRHCFRHLGAEVSERRRYCNEDCRNAARQRRFRELRPERVMQIQERYWRSIV